MQETTLTAMLMTCPYVASLSHRQYCRFSTNSMSSYFGSEILQQDDEFGPLKYGHVIKFPGGDEEKAEEMGEKERWSGEMLLRLSGGSLSNSFFFFLHFSSLHSGDRDSHTTHKTRGTDGSGWAANTLCSCFSFLPLLISMFSTGLAILIISSPDLHHRSAAGFFLSFLRRRRH